MSFQSFNPTTGELIGTYEEQDDAEVNRLLQKSHAAVTPGPLRDEGTL